MAASSDYGQSVADSAMNTGKSAVSAFNPSDTSGKTLSGFNNLFGTQANQQNDYIKQYTDTIKNNPTVTQLYDTANTQYNVPGLAQNANYLNNQVLQTPQQQLNTMRGFNADQNQVNNATNQQLRILQPLASAATTNLQTAQGLAQGQVQAGIQQNATNLLPVQAQGQMQSDLWARQASGYTTAAEQEFQGLISKMNAGVQLSQNEMARANALASAEATYQSSLMSAQSAQNVARINAQNVTLPQGSTYLNTASGQAYNPFAKVA